MLHQPEVWRPIAGAEGYYSVSNEGRIRSEPVPGKARRGRGRVLTPSLDSKGYPIFKLCVPGQKQRTTKVHRVVAMAFIRPPLPGEQVNHINGIKTDNRVGNLEYLSCKENIRHAWRNKLHSATHCCGARNPNAKLTDDAVRRIRAEFPGRKALDLARQYGVSKQAIFSVVKRNSWASVG